MWIWHFGSEAQVWKASMIFAQSAAAEKSRDNWTLSRNMVIWRLTQIDLFFLSFAVVSLVHFLCFMGKREIAALFVLQCWIKLTRFILFMLSCYATLASVIRDIGADLIVLINSSSCFSQLLELFDGWRGEISGKAMSDSIFSDFPLQQSRRH